MFFKEKDGDFLIYTISYKGVNKSPGNVIQEKNKLTIRHSINSEMKFHLGNASEYDIVLSFHKVLENGIVFEVQILDLDPSYVLEKVQKIEKEKNIKISEEEIQNLYRKPREDFIKSHLVIDPKYRYENQSNLVFIPSKGKISISNYEIKLNSIVRGVMKEC